jgi:hypothetical protein
MIIAKRFFLTSILAAALALPALAYNDVVTHPQFTIVATQKSALYADGSIMFALGLFPADKQLFLYGARAGNVRLGSATYPLSAFVGEGAFDEDIGTRALNHFFDPAFDRPLSFAGVSLGRRSWEWTLEETPISGQDFSVRDARAYLTRALTFNDGPAAASEEQRGMAMATMFLSLGHAVHHLQDMAQPQHVRNDMHLDQGAFFFNPFYNPSRYERYTAERNPVVQALAQTANPVFPGSGDFKTARDFWFNGAGTGIAQRTNQDFVSQGTNFTIFGTLINHGTYALPVPGASTDYTVEQLHAQSGIAVPPEIQTLCGNPAIACTMTMFATAVEPRASTLSIFDQDLRARGVFVTYNEGDLTPTYQTQRLFDLNRFNFDDAHPLLITRAVSYSAGFLSHFFRGKLQVTPPATGPYAVVDHSAGIGFTTIKATVTNATPGEALPAGTLRAIAKFHRNGCYQADLSGEFTLDASGQLVTPCPDFRSVESHLSLTAEEAASFGVGESKQMTFTFSDPIPLDATDLILQVYYTGTVGTETETFALGAADLSEPTFVAVMNATDVFELSGTLFDYWREIIKPANIANPPYSVIDIDGNHVYNSPPDVNVAGGDINYEIFVNGKKAGDVAALPEGRFARIAALVSPNGFTLTLIARGNGFNDITSYGFGAKTLQYDPNQNAIIVSVVDPLRNDALQFDSVSFYHFFPSTGTSLDDMPKSLATDAHVLVPVTIVAQSLLQLHPASEQWTRSLDVFRAIDSSVFALMWQGPGPSVARPLSTPSAARSRTVMRGGRGGTQAARRTKAQPLHPVNVQ